ncbi:MAG: ribonuclease P protein component [Elusimicrobiota bacterium]|nr:ribonuclease P protein component [Elusimicrobiota bacterium]
MRKRKDFERIFQSKNKIISENFIIIICDNYLQKHRIAISIKKQIANAVQRNRMKRLIREIFRLNKYLIFSKKSPQDILIIVKKNFCYEKFNFIEKELLHLWENLK